MLWTQALGAERGGLSARPHCGRRRRRRAGPERPSTFAAATLGAERAARGATLAPGLNHGPKMAGTGKMGARFPVPSAPPAGAGRQPRAAPPVPGARRVARGTRKDKGQLTRAPGRPRHCPGEKGNGEWGAAAVTPAGSAVPGLAMGGSGRRPWLRRHRDAGSAAGSQGLQAHPGPWLTPAARSLAGAGRCRRTGGRWGPKPQKRCERRRGPRRPRSSRAGSGGPAPSSRAQKEACLVWASCGAAGLAPFGPSQTPGRGLLGIPHPPPAPLPWTICLRPLRSASQLVWQLGGTVRV